MKKTLFAALLLSAGLFASCNKSNNPGNDCPTPAPHPAPGTSIAPGGCIPPTDGPCDSPSTASCDHVVCTMDFVTLKLQVTDASAAPVVLDSFLVTDLNGNPVPMGYGILPGGCVEPGVYQIANDSWVQGHQNTTMPVRAKGYKSGALVVNEMVTIGADCCHVYRASGPGSVVVPN